MARVLLNGNGWILSCSVGWIVNSLGGGTLIF